MHLYLSAVLHRIFRVVSNQMSTEQNTQPIVAVHSRSFKHNDICFLEMPTWLCQQSCLYHRPAQQCFCGNIKQSVWRCVRRQLRESVLCLPICVNGVCKLSPRQDWLTCRLVRRFLVCSQVCQEPVLNIQAVLVQVRKPNFGPIRSHCCTTLGIRRAACCMSSLHNAGTLSLSTQRLHRVQCRSLTRFPQQAERSKTIAKAINRFELIFTNHIDCWKRKVEGQKIQTRIVFHLVTFRKCWRSCQCFGGSSQ